MLEARWKKLRQRMEQEAVEALLVQNPSNLRYLSGFTSGEDASLLVTPDEIYLFTDARYREQAHRECPDCTYVEYTRELLDRLKDFCIKYKRLAVESHQITYADYRKLEEAIGSVTLIPIAGWIEAMRQVKDETELGFLRRSAAMSASVFEPLLNIVKPGVSEKEVALELEFMLKRAGAESLSFPIIAVAGANAALPHGKPGTYILQPGDMLTLDWGGTAAGYVSDMTRTIVITAASRRLQDLYARVLEAQMAGLEMVKAGTEAATIDGKVRKVLSGYGLEQYFLHSTGHALGLDIHEAPALSAHSLEILKAGMVVTIEPGIYIPGFGGIRIEDSVIVTEAGYENLIPIKKELITI